MRRHLGDGARADVVVVLGTFVGLGLLGGLLWWLLVDPAEYTLAPGGGAMGELELSKRFNADGWYSVLALVLGFPSGLLLTWWRSRDYRLTSALLVLGAALAAGVMAVTGRLLGPGDPDAALTGAKRGARVPVELVVTADVAYLLWPIAVLAGALMVLWSSPGLPRGPEQPVGDPAGPASQGHPDSERADH